MIVVSPPKQLILAELADANKAAGCNTEILVEVLQFLLSFTVTVYKPATKLPKVFDAV